MMEKWPLYKAVYSIWGPFKLQGEKSSYIIIVEISLFFLPQNNLFLFKIAIESNYFFLPSWSNPSFCMYSSCVMTSHTISLPVTLLICPRFAAYALKLGTHLAMSDSAQHSVAVYFPYSERYTFANLALNCSKAFISQVPVLAYRIFAIKYNPWSFHMNSVQPVHSPPIPDICISIFLIQSHLINCRAIL